MTKKNLGRQKSHFLPKYTKYFEKMIFFSENLSAERAMPPSAHLGTCMPIKGFCFLIKIVCTSFISGKFPINTYLSIWSKIPIEFEALLYYIPRQNRFAFYKYLIETEFS